MHYIIIYHPKETLHLNSTPHCSPRYNLIMGVGRSILWKDVWEERDGQQGAQKEKTQGPGSRRLYQGLLLPVGVPGGPE